MPSSRALSLHRLFLRSAQAGAMLFAWIFIFQYFAESVDMTEATLYTALTFGLAHGVAFLITPFGARAVRNGVRMRALKALAILTISYALLGGVFLEYITPALWGIAGFAVLFGIYRALYWISYHAHMMQGSRNALYEVVVACMPLLFGYLTLYGSHPALVFGAAATLVFLAFLAELRIPDVVERYPWGIGETFAEFFRKSHRGVVVRSCIDGAHSAALFLLWPLAVFILLDQSYVLLGIVFSLTLLAVLFVRYLFGTSFMRSVVWHRPSVRAAHAISAWVLRLLAATPLSIIAVGVYAHAHGNDREEIDLFAFEYTADQGVYLDEHTALKEMGASLGKVLAALAFGVLALYMSVLSAFAVVFVLVALLAGASLFIGRRSVLY